MAKTDDELQDTLEDAIDSAASAKSYSTADGRSKTNHSLKELLDAANVHRALSNRRANGAMRVGKIQRPK